MLIRNIKIGRRLYLGFSLIVLLTLILSFYSLVYISKIWKDTESIYNHPFKVIQAEGNIKVGITNIELLMHHSSCASTEKERLKYEVELKMEISYILSQLEVFDHQYLGNKQEINMFRENFLLWKQKKIDPFILARGKTKSNISNDVKLISEKDILADSLQRRINLMMIFTETKAASFYSQALVNKQSIVMLLRFFLITSILISLLLSIVITRSITMPLNKIVESIRKIAKGDLMNPLQVEAKDEVGDLAVSYNLMQKNLVEKSNVAAKIAEGIFVERVESYGTKDVLANSINLIAENFTMVVKQAQQVALGNYEETVGESNSNQLTIVINQMLQGLKKVVIKARQIAEGDYSGSVVPASDFDELAKALNVMTVSLRNITEQNDRQNRLKTAQNELNQKMSGDLSIQVLAKNVISFITTFIHAQMGAFYSFVEEEKLYKLQGSYAYSFRKGVHSEFMEGEGLVGQAALEREIITFSELPDDYTKIVSALGETIPRHLIVAPFIYNGQTVGVLELASANPFTEENYEFLIAVLDNIAISVVSSNSRERMVKLLAVTKEQAEELQVQQEELRQTNEELEAQTTTLKKSEEYLQAQQEELRVTNEELEEKTRSLEKQKSQIEIQNRDLEVARNEIEGKAKELEITNKYKSEFLANMSHELRTPLNSLLILSQTLAEDNQKTLTDDQRESARIIYNSGKDLLILINDILDLSKIESGKMQVDFQPVAVDELLQNLRTYFQPMIVNKGLASSFSKTGEIPSEIVTDGQRLNQILRNLLSNSIKFTEKGKIEVRVYKPEKIEMSQKFALDGKKVIAFSVKDTGIGIAEEKQQQIFEAFQQADGSISRKYGGTGLGLSITRELTKLLGGEIRLHSIAGEGSEFKIFIPVDNSTKHNTSLSGDIEVKVLSDHDSIRERNVPILLNTTKSDAPNDVKIKSINDDHETTKINDHSMLIIDDDPRFADILANLCRKKGFKCLAAATGEDGIELAKKFIPKGILLDISLPGIDGWEVLRRLKESPETRHIPVHFISGYEESIDAFNKGAVGYLTKPVTREKLEQTFDEIQFFISKKMKDLLVVEDDNNLRQSIKLLLGSTDIMITECSTGKDAFELISGKFFDCIVLDLGLPDMSGFDLLKKLEQKHVKIPPIVIYTGKEITKAENEELQQYTQSIIIKGVKSDERLLDETALFLHRVVDEMPERQKKMLINLYDKEQMFRNKKIMVVDDDMRNVFALTQILESSKMKVVMAQNGQKAVELLDKDPSFDMVLMDIMMPVMDGYVAMKKIRQDVRFTKLPIIALTAKAMKEDREKCIAAGANDYLSKPVDIEKLFNLMRIWLYQ
jgi:CheY-like chemotaxis protein/methyl-accepting chemotaxis protein